MSLHTLGYLPRYGDEPGLSALMKYDQVVYGWGDAEIGDPDQLGPAAGSDYQTSRDAESWWGLCSGWAAAAVMEPEPTLGATYESTLFTADDVKALAIRLYDKAPSVVVGEPCPEDALPSGDLLGSDGACQDVNAGAFFVVVTNLLGSYHHALPEDADPGPGVSTQIAFAYRIVEDWTLTEDEAVAMLGFPGKRYGEITGNHDASAWTYVEMEVDYRTAAPYPGAGSSILGETFHTEQYTSILELDGDGKVIGGEWAGASQSRHPDFFWIPFGTDRTNASLTPSDVEQLIDSAKDGPRVSSKLAAEVEVVARATATLAERTERSDPGDLSPQIRRNLLRAAESASEALDASMDLLIEADDSSGHERRVLGLRAAARVRHAMAQIHAFEAVVHGGMNGRYPRIAEDVGLGLIAYSEELIVFGDGIADVVADMAHSDGR